MKKIAVLASGSGSNFQAIIDACENGGINGEVVLLIYNRKDAFAKDRAAKHGIKSQYINRIACGDVDTMQQEVYDALLNSGTDMVVLAGYLEKIGTDVVVHYKNKIVNTHPSLIPMFCGDGYYGQRVHQAVIDKGVKVSGCTIHLVDENYDTGPILIQKCVEVEQDDTAKSLAERILRMNIKRW